MNDSEVIWLKHQGIDFKDKAVKSIWWRVILHNMKRVKEIWSRCKTCQHTG